MADEAKDHDAISNIGTNPNAASARQPQDAASITIPEVRILEEHVTHAAAKHVVASSPAPASVAPVAPSAPTPKPVIPAPVAEKPQPIPQPILSPPPALTPVPSPQPMPVEKNPSVLGDDIASILKGIKLPERFDKKGAADIKTPLPTSTPPQAAPLQESVANPAMVPPVLTPQEAEKNAGSVAAVHTLKNDLQSVVREQKISVVRAVSLEEDRRAHRAAGPEETSATAQRSKRTWGIIFSIVLLLVLGAAALFGVFTIMNQQNSPPPIVTTSSILFAEQSVLLSLDNQSPNDLKRILLAARNASSGTLGSITRIIPIITDTPADGASAAPTPAPRPATFREFMGTMGAHPPDDLLRALSDDFFLGLHTVDKNAPLIIVPVTDHERAFAAMLAWEETMNPDLAPLFSPVPSLKADKDGLPVKRTYEDLVMRNFDVRALKDDAGTVQLFYSFPTQNILVIAESPYSFTEILSRLQAGRKL